MSLVLCVKIFRLTHLEFFSVTFFFSFVSFTKFFFWKYIFFPNLEFFEFFPFLASFDIIYPKISRPPKHYKY